MGKRSAKIESFPRNHGLHSMGAFDNFSEHQGSAVITYNIHNKAITKTYIGDDKVFVGPGRGSDDYCGFAYLDDYYGPPGVFGIVDYERGEIIFLELKNIAEMNFQYQWVIAAAAGQPIDWEAWGRTTDGTVRCAFIMSSRILMKSVTKLCPARRE